MLKKTVTEDYFVIKREEKIMSCSRGVVKGSSWRVQDENLYLTELVAGKQKPKLQQATYSVD